MDGLRTEVCGQQQQSNGPRNNQHNPWYANYWAPLTRRRHIPPHPAQPRHTNHWAPRTRKRYQQEHRPQRPTERSDPTQHAEGRTGDCPGPRKGATTRRNVTRGGGAPRGTRAGTPDKEEGHSKAGEATRTAGTGNQNGANGGACPWEAATTKGMAWPASPVATGCQGNPCSTGIRWGVSPAAQMGCLRNRSGSPSGADQP